MSAPAPAQVYLVFTLRLQMQSACAGGDFGILHSCSTLRGVLVATQHQTDTCTPPVLKTNEYHTCSSKEVRAGLCQPTGICDNTPAQVSARRTSTKALASTRKRARTVALARSHARRATVEVGVGCGKSIDVGTDQAQYKPTSQPQPRPAPCTGERLYVVDSHTKPNLGLILAR